MKVSVAMVTYNHEKFIAKALDSVLMQSTNFDYEIVIGEDCSTDNTRSILLDYQKRHPGKFRLLLHEKNLGMHLNGAQTLDACKGEYIAMLDGDDYWTSPEKLQKQVDFLDSHPACAVCFHNALIVYEDGSREPISYRPNQKAFSTIIDLFLDNYIPTCAVMFRSGLFGKVPEWIGTLKMGDWLIHILNALHGNIGYLDETMAVYVVHPGGVWSTKNWQDHEPAMIAMFEALVVNLGPRYAGILLRILRWRCFALSRRYEEIGDLTRARTYAGESLKKHFLLLSRPLRYGKRSYPDTISSLPHYIKSINSAILFKSMLRLYVVPLLRSHVHPLYKALRAIARRLNLGL
jgi:glycosyltransferase involved in cell wall biosynthesis